MALFEYAEIIDEHLNALADAIELEGAGPYELLVCGGAALAATGMVQRATDDIDVLSIVIGGQPSGQTEFPEDLQSAADTVARTKNLPGKWLNPGPAGMQDFGLPDGIVERATAKSYSERLTVHFLSRYDQIHLKLYAAVDQLGGKHLSDLETLEPAEDELLDAAKWAMKQDPSTGFRKQLEWYLEEENWHGVVEKLSQ